MSFYAIRTFKQIADQKHKVSAKLLTGVSGNGFFDFGNGNGNCSTHSQILGTGTGMKNSIPNFWERERE